MEFCIDFVQFCTEGTARRGPVSCVVGPEGRFRAAVFQQGDLRPSSGENFKMQSFGGVLRSFRVSSWSASYSSILHFSFCDLHSSFDPPRLVVPLFAEDVQDVQPPDPVFVLNLPHEKNPREGQQDIGCPHSQQGREQAAVGQLFTGNQQGPIGHKKTQAQGNGHYEPSPAGHDPNRRPDQHKYNTGKRDGELLMDLHLVAVNPLQVTSEKIKITCQSAPQIIGPAHKPDGILFGKSGTVRDVCLPSLHHHQGFLLDQFGGKCVACLGGNAIGDTVLDCRYLVPVALNFFKHHLDIHFPVAAELALPALQVEIVNRDDNAVLLELQTAVLVVIRQGQLVDFAIFKMEQNSVIDDLHSALVCENGHLVGAIVFAVDKDVFEYGPIPVSGHHSIGGQIIYEKAHFNGQVGPLPIDIRREEPSFVIGVGEHLIVEVDEA